VPVLVTDASPGCVEAKSHSDLAWIQANVFEPKCTFSACHNGGVHSLEDLRTLDSTYATTVGIPSRLFPAYRLVVPNEPANSYLLSILRGGPLPIDATAGTMPMGQPRLCHERIDAIERWILAGAPKT
jgi:hypothetical protein